MRPGGRREWNCETDRCRSENFSFLLRESLLLESQRRIIFKMEELSPGRGWLLDGARVIKAQNGKDFSLSRLNAIFHSQENNEGRAPTFTFTLFFLKKPALVLIWAGSISSGILP